MWVFLGLVVADIAIGLGYICSPGAWPPDYSSAAGGCWTCLVGVSGSRSQSVPGGARRPLPRPDQRASACSPWSSPPTCSCARPSPRARLAPADADRIRELLAKHGDRDSLGYFALRDDKSVIWSADRQGLHLLPGGVRASCWPAATRSATPRRGRAPSSAFLDEAARHAWAPAVMGCSELGAEVWCREGDLTALELGDEAIVNVADFSLSGRPMRNVRQMVNRVAAQRLHAPRCAGSATSPEAEIEAILGAARLLAGQPHRARLLHGPGPVRRDPATRTACWPPPRAERRAAGRPALRALGHRRPLPGPHAPRPSRPARAERLPDRRGHQGRARARASSALAELRGVPRRAGARRADRRRPGAAGLAGDPADLRLPVVPDRVAVQVQRQVQPGLAAAVLVFPAATTSRGSRSPRSRPRPSWSGRRWRSGPARRPVRRLGAWRGDGRRTPGGRTPGGCSPRRWRAGPTSGGCRGRCLVMGVVNVTPDSFSDGGPGSSPSDGDRARPGPRRPGRRPGRRRRRVDPARRPAGRASTRSCAGSARRDASWPGGRAGQRRHHAAVGGRAGPRRRGPAGQRRQRRPGRPGHAAGWSPRPGARTSSCTGAATATTWTPGRSTTTSSPTSRDELARRVDAVVAAGRRPEPDHPRSRPRLRQAQPSTTGRCSPACDAPRSAPGPSRCWSAPPASASWAGCWPGRTARRARSPGRDDATVAITALAAAAGAWCVRVHRVPANADAVRVAAAWRAAGPVGESTDGPD